MEFGEGDSGCGERGDTTAAYNLHWSQSSELVGSVRLKVTAVIASRDGQLGNICVSESR